MNEARAIARCEEAAALLPPRFRRAALQMPDHRKRYTEEFRLRAGQPPAALLPEGEVSLPYFGADSRVTPRDLAQMVDTVTDYSRYACAETLRQGFLCLHGGFRLGVCGTAVFGSARAGAYLYLIHVGAALVTGVLLRRNLGLPRRKAVSRQRAPFDLAAALPAAVQSSFAAVGSVSAFVIFFMVLLRLLSLMPALAALPPLPRAALFGFVEMTNGVNALPATRAGFVLCAAIMNWGGLSVQAQTRALLAGSALSARRCVIGKAVQALAGVPLALLAAQRLF